MRSKQKRGKLCIALEDGGKTPSIAMLWGKKNTHANQRGQEMERDGDMQRGDGEKPIFDVPSFVEP